MGQWSKKCETDSTWKPHLHNGFSKSCRLVNAWIYVFEDNWDQDGVLLETWFLADYDI